MRKKSKYIALLAIGFATLLLFSCKKKTIDPPVGDMSPVFKLNATFDSEGINIEAGKQNCFMTTFMDKSNGVELFSGKLGTEELFVEMGVYNGDVDIVQPFSLKNFQGNLTFAQTSSMPLLTLSKDDFPNAVLINEVKWFVDGELAGINTAVLSLPGKYTICAQVKFFDQTEATVCNELLIGYQVNAQCKMRYFMTAQGHLKVWMDESSVGVDHINWKIDGVSVGTISLLDTYVNQGLHNIEAEVFFQNGAVKKKSMVIDGSNTGKMVYDFSSLETSIVNPVNWDYTIVLKVKKDGKLYSSLNTSNYESQISISEIAYYGLNAQGKRVYKCVAYIDAMLAEEGSTNTKHFQGTTTFGVEIP